jgi:hypothetical protein
LGFHWIQSVAIDVFETPDLICSHLGHFDRSFSLPSLFESCNALHPDEKAPWLC